jgi:hypothetical protein
MAIVKAILPYFILTILTIVWWKFATLIDKYAWNPAGKELVMLDISLTTIFIYKVVFWLIVGNSALFTFITYLKRKRKIALVSGLVTLLVYFFGGHWVNKEVAFAYFAVFRNQSVSEEFIERPVLESGYYIGPELTEYIPKKSAKDRRYAISGLGKIKYEPATSTLAGILFDLDEPDYIRADAFVALKTIGTQDSHAVITDFEKKGDPNVLDLIKDE